MYLFNDQMTKESDEKMKQLTLAAMWLYAHVHVHTCSIEIGDLCVHFSLSQQYTIHSQNIHALTYQYRRILILCMQLAMQFRSTA